MYIVTINDIKVTAYSVFEVNRYMEIVNDQRYSIDDMFIKIHDDIYIRANMTRGDLYKAMGYKTFDFAYPEPWADTAEAKKLFKTYGVKTDSPSRPYHANLVWCYDPPSGSDRGSIFGYPVFDKQVLRDMGELLFAAILAGDCKKLDIDKWLE